MTVYSYEEVTPSPIENATVKKMFADGVFKAFFVEPVSGYGLHDRRRDWEETNEETGQQLRYLGFTTGSVSCGAGYDFVENPFEFYAIAESDIPTEPAFEEVEESIVPYGHLSNTEALNIITGGIVT